MDLNNTSRLNYGVFDNVYSYGWMQAPILYDSQNNGYYLDPNGTSRLNYTVNDNVYSYGWMQAPIFYDANNNGYYVDPSSASVFNVVYAYQFNCLSDIQLKKDIQPIGNALDKILTLRGVKFNWKDPAMGAGNQVGLIAQDVEKVLPEVVSKNGDGYLSVDYSKLSPLLIEAVKDLKTEKDQEINNLQQKIDILEADKKTKDETLNDLLKRIEALESK